VRVEPVEIYSDQSNAGVMRHPGRRFPGVLVQGDTLCNLYKMADRACDDLHLGEFGEAKLELTELANLLQHLIVHYKVVLGQHRLPLPFSDQP
jgi:hypothetical protein